MARGIANRGSLRDFKSGHSLQIGPREITNWGRDFKSRQGLQIGGEHSKPRMKVAGSLISLALVFIFYCLYFPF